MYMTFPNSAGHKSFINSRADNRESRDGWRKYWEFNPYKSNENSDRHKQSLYALWAIRSRTVNRKYL